MWYTVGMSSYVIPLFPAAAASPLPTRDAVAAELSRLRDRVDAGLPGKADKVPSASAGNLASLDASGNLADSGATPASIKAAAVAEVVANAPGTMDTLEEIAGILGTESGQAAGGILKRVSDLESGKVAKVAGKGLSSEDFTAAEKQKLSGLSAQVPADWSQADADRYNKGECEKKWHGFKKKGVGVVYADENEVRIAREHFPNEGVAGKQRI